MTLGQFRELTEDISEDSELIIMFQPHYPLKASVQDVLPEGDKDSRIYIVQGNQDYATQEDCDAVGW